MRKKNLVTAVLVASMLVGSFGVTSTPAEAKSKIKLSTKSVSLNGGASKTITLKGTKKKVKWTIVSGKKNIKLKNKKKTSVKIVGVKRGTAKVQAKLGKKKYICRVTVRKSTPAKTITITTADTQTAEVVHNALNTGEAVNLKVKGSKSSAGNLMSELSKAVGKYNGYGVVIQRSSSNRTVASTYTTYSISSYDAQLYKYGVLLAKDIVDNLKWWYSREVEARKGSLQREETRIKDKYAVGSDNYNTIFKEITGVSYDKDFVINGTSSYSRDCNYPDGQIAKSKSLNLEEKLSYNLPSNWDYMSWEHNGETRKYSSNDGVYLKRCGATKGDFENYRIFNPWNYDYELKLSDVTFHYVESETGVDVYSPKIYIEPDEEDKYYDLPQDWYYLTYKDDTGKIQYYTDDTYFVLSQEEADAEDYENYTLKFDWVGYGSNAEATKKVKFSDVTFHYKPLTVDTAKVESTINSKIQSELKAYKTSARYDDSVEPILNTPFTELSQAYQMYYICQAFGEGGENVKEDWTAYAYGKAASMRGGKYKGMKNPKGRVDAGDGLSGVKAMLNHKWMGVCQDYTRMEITMYNLFGIKRTAYISCRGCDHSWSAVMVVNSRGERAWLKNDSGSTKSGYKTVPYCSKHDSKAERIPNFVN